MAAGESPCPLCCAMIPYGFKNCINPWCNNKRVAMVDVMVAAAALETKLTEIFADSRYISLFSSYENRGMKYTGPTCEKELEELREALRAYKGA